MKSKQKRGIFNEDILSECNENKNGFNGILNSIN